MCTSETLFQSQVLVEFILLMVFEKVATKPVLQNIAIFLILNLPLIANYIFKMLRNTHILLWKTVFLSLSRNSIDFLGPMRGKLDWKLPGKYLLGGMLQDNVLDVDVCVRQAQHT